jgi:hypothetical protein
LTNVDNAIEIGTKVVCDLEGNDILGVTMKRSNRAITMGDDSKIKITASQAIDPALLFQRLLVFSRAGDVSLEKAMEFELSPFPAALFKATGVMHSPEKPQLAHALIDHILKISPSAIF